MSREAVRHISAFSNSFPIPIGISLKLEMEHNICLFLNYT